MVLLLQLHLISTSESFTPVVNQGYGFHLSVPNNWVKVGPQEYTMQHVSPDKRQGVNVMMFSPGSFTLDDFGNNAYVFLISQSTSKDSIITGSGYIGSYPYNVLRYPNGLIQYTSGNNAIYQLVYIRNQANSNAIGFSLV
jgi:hypothetical protein